MNDHYNLDFQLSEEILDVGGQEGLIATSFLRFLENVYLNSVDLQTIADSCLHQLKAIGIHHNLTGSLLFHEDDQNGAKFVLSYGDVTPLPVLKSTVTDVIVAWSGLVDQEISTTEAALERRCSDLPEEGRQAMLEDKLRSSFGVALAHELTHALATNRKSGRFQHMPLPELELATDSIAFLSCDELFGEMSCFGVPYIHEQLKKDGIEISRDSVRELALRTVEVL